MQRTSRKYFQNNNNSKMLNKDFVLEFAKNSCNAIAKTINGQNI